MLIHLPHFTNEPYLLQEQPGTLPSQAGSSPGDGQVLAGAAPGDDVHRRHVRTFQFGDIPQLGHVREAQGCHLQGERLDLAGPHRDDAHPLGGQGEPADTVEQAAQGDAHGAIPIPGDSCCSCSCPSRKGTRSMSGSTYPWEVNTPQLSRRHCLAQAVSRSLYNSS